MYKPPFFAGAILELHNQTVALWHHEQAKNSFTAFNEIVCQQHIYNFNLWHQEDIARSPDVSDADIAEVKRNIDKLNQQRNDWIEKLDDWLSSYVEENKIVPVEKAKQNSETPGSMIDRLSIISLRIYHLDEQANREGIDQAQKEKVEMRAAICRVQQSELAQCLDEAIDEIISGQKRHRTYRQFKMYNDPTLNPYLYDRSKKRQQEATNDLPVGSRTY